MRSFKIILFLSAATLVASCSTLMSGQTQKVTLKTPGAYNAECYLDNGNRYRVVTDETVLIMRSQKPLEVDCYAPGNRHLIKTIDRDFNDWTIANISNGIVPGVTYDHFSNAMYEYPKTISVDFSGMASPGFESPDYHNKDAASPYGQPIESYTPASPEIPSDNTYMKRGVAKVSQDVNSNPFDTGVVTSEPATTSGSASGDVTVAPKPASTTTSKSTTPKTSAGAQPVLKGSNAEELNRSMNPTVFK